MRNPPNDTGLVAADTDAAPEGARRRSGARIADDSERRCILSGEKAHPDTLIRLALSPDGLVLPDILAKAPGRGAWIAVDRAALETALAKGKLRGALARAFKGAALTIPDDLPDRVAAGLQRATLDRLGMESRASTVLTGAERIETAARQGKVALLLHASDAADDGRRRLAQAWRVGEDEEGSGRMGTTIPADRIALSIAMGRENAVHIAITDPRAAARVQSVLNRWQFYIGSAKDAANPARTMSGGAAVPAHPAENDV